MNHDEMLNDLKFLLQFKSKAIDVYYAAVKYANYRPFNVYKMFISHSHEINTLK